MFHGFHELIKLLDFLFPLYSLRCTHEEMACHLTAALPLALSSSCESKDAMDGVPGQTDVMEVNEWVNGSLEYDT